MITLDLHGVRHADAYRLVEQFIYSNQDIPKCIITGNSTKMHLIVKECAAELGYNTFESKPTEIIIY